VKTRYGVIGVFVVLAIGLVGLLGSGYRPSSDAGAASLKNQSQVVDQQFQSIDEAQAVTPFRIRQLSVPKGYRLGSATVRTQDALNGTSVLVTLTFVSASHDTVILQESSTDYEVSFPGETTTTLATVNGVAGQAISGHNTSGVPVGCVRWKAQNLYFTLIRTHSTGPAIVPVANSVN